MYIKNFGEFYNNQVEYAGSIILSRTGDVAEDKLNESVALLREHNEKAAIITTPWDEPVSYTHLDNKERSLIKDGGSIDTWTDYEKEQLVLEFYNASKGIDYAKAAKINFLKQKTVLNESQKQKIKIK